MVNLELYRVFYTVAKCGSLTKAAEELFISQPAVSQAIKQLENQLGAPLFNRTHRGMELSLQGGKLIFKQVEEALQLLDDAEHKIGELQTTATGTIRIAATDAIFSHLLADKIVKYNTKFPGVKIDLITGTTPETLEQLKDNKCDVAFVNMPVEDKDVNLTGTVAHLTDVFVAGKKYEKLKDTEIKLADLQEFPLLMIESNTIARKSLSLYTQTLGLQLHPDIEVENWDLMIKFAINGMGIGCVPKEYAQPYIDSGELFVVNVTPCLPVRGVGMALPKNVSLQYALKEFIAMFK
ncbi:MAG: LysR family transcriptional regulator [Candidatus Coproplasma sp.]